MEPLGLVTAQQIRSAGRWIWVVDCQTREPNVVGVRARRVKYSADPSTKLGSAAGVGNRDLLTSGLLVLQATFEQLWTGVQVHVSRLCLPPRRLTGRGPVWGSGG